MPRADSTYPFPSDGPNAVLREDGIESGLNGKLQGLKYDYRPDITNRAALEQNFREKFEALNRVRLTDADCQARQRAPTSRSHPAEPARSEGQFARLLNIIRHSKFIIRHSNWPYQVYAVQHMVKRIDDDNGNGFIWHTTSSGKTLTSFKASTLLKENDNIHKFVFVVDCNHPQPSTLAA